MAFGEGAGRPCETGAGHRLRARSRPPGSPAVAVCRFCVRPVSYAFTFMTLGGLGLCRASAGRVTLTMAWPIAAEMPFTLDGGQYHAVTERKPHYAKGACLLGGGRVCPPTHLGARRPSATLTRTVSVLSFVLVAIACRAWRAFARRALARPVTLTGTVGLLNRLLSNK